MAKKKAAFKFAQGDPLLKQKRESKNAHKALTDYALMGTARSLRSLLAAYKVQTKPKPPTDKWSTLTTWSVNYKWQERVNRFDDIQQERDLILWQQRRAELREADYTTGATLRTRALEMLDKLGQFLTTTETIEKGLHGEDVIVIRMRANFSVSELARVAQIASQLQTLAAQMPTERVLLSAETMDQMIEQELKVMQDRQNDH